MEVVSANGLDIAYERVGRGPALLEAVAADVRQFERSIPDARLVVIPDCGHISNLERPLEFNKAVSEFCR